MTARLRVSAARNQQRSVRRRCRNEASAFGEAVTGRGVLSCFDGSTFAMLDWKLAVLQKCGCAKSNPRAGCQPAPRESSKKDETERASPGSQRKAGAWLRNQTPA